MRHAIEKDEFIPTVKTTFLNTDVRLEFLVGDYFFLVSKLEAALNQGTLTLILN